MLERPFPFSISKKPGEITIFGSFFSEKINFGLYFVENQHSQVGHALLRHYDLIRWPISMILVSMKRGDPTLYYGTKQLYFGRVNIKFTGVVTTSLRKTCYQKKKKKKGGLRSNNILSGSKWYINIRLIRYSSGCSNNIQLFKHRLVDMHMEWTLLI